MLRSLIAQTWFFFYLIDRCFLPSHTLRAIFKLNLRQAFCFIYNNITHNIGTHKLFQSAWAECLFLTVLGWSERPNMVSNLKTTFLVIFWKEDPLTPIWKLLLDNRIGSRITLCFVETVGLTWFCCQRSNYRTNLQGLNMKITFLTCSVDSSESEKGSRGWVHGPWEVKMYNQNVPLSVPSKGHFLVLECTLKGSFDGFLNIKTKKWPFERMLKDKKMTLWAYAQWLFERTLKDPKNDPFSISSRTQKWSVHFIIRSLGDDDITWYYTNYLIHCFESNHY